MPEVLIDTSAWVEALRNNGDDEIRQRVFSLITKDKAVWNPMIQLELWNGARGKPERDMIVMMTQNIHNYEIKSDVWVKSFQIAKNARHRGLTVPSTDILIYACAVHYEAELLHKDRHFDLLSKL